MTTYAALVRWCTTCEDDVAFEQPGCMDGHGGDCPEWVCVQCGDAVLIGFSLPDQVSAARAARHVA